jgi:hypothetical protein
MTFVMPESRGISLPHCLLHGYTFQYKQTRQRNGSLSSMCDEHAGRSRRVVVSHLPLS